MIIRMKKNMTCTDSALCHDSIQAKIDTITNINFVPDSITKKHEAYLYVNHIQNNHLIIVCIYNTIKHETVSSLEIKEFVQTGNIIERPIEKSSSPFVQKTTKTMPTKIQLQAVL